MAGTKRAAGAGAETRASKMAKTDNSTSKSSTSKSRAKKGAKVRRLIFSTILLNASSPFLLQQTALPTAKFKAAAMPLHVNLTHTPPTIADPDTEAVSTATVDPGFIGNLTLVPSTFTTGSYGWKGSKRITVELKNAESEGENEKVQVMLTINATVVGSKQAKSDKDDDEEDTKKTDEEAKEDEDPDVEEDA
ncbi:hypothetical protein Hypma_008640 [Hypsizygus marmoreus]|uniref:Uncharacterized protein n=1 Tax=Hypsizygus marmoreus TaxID=39966 RepID=A0A369JZ89_HYPMA|nr:hypothetical protein Hypma_008640 [Hypsizygus marmoreus]